MIKYLSKLLIVFCFLYCETSGQNNWLDSRVETQASSNNNSKYYILFDNSGDGSLTKIYSPTENKVQYILPINNSMIKVISNDMLQ